jgi:hypothetical protein
MKQLVVRRIDQSSESIFVCYRRADSADTVDRIYESLRRSFTESDVFRDVNSIAPGDVFPSHIAQVLKKCRVALVVIGPGWLNARENEEGPRRLDEPLDHVRVEIETALGIESLKVIPVLVRNAVMPKSGQLPETFRELLNRSAVNVRPNPDFSGDMSRLVRDLRPLLADTSRWRMWRRIIQRSKRWVALSACVIVVLVAAILLYPRGLSPVPQPTPAPTMPPPIPGPTLDIIPAIHALHVIELGLDVAFITSQQAQVTEVESGGAAAKAGLNIGDIIEVVGNQKIDTLDDMRKSFRELGPGKTKFTIRRSGVQKTILVDCPNC